MLPTCVKHVKAKTEETGTSRVCRKTCSPWRQTNGTRTKQEVFALGNLREVIFLRFFVKFMH